MCKLMNEVFDIVTHKEKVKNELINYPIILNNKETKQ